MSLGHVSVLSRSFFAVSVVSVMFWWRVCPVWLLWCIGSILVVTGKPPDVVAKAVLLARSAFVAAQVLCSGGVPAPHASKSSGLRRCCLPSLLSRPTGLAGLTVKDTIMEHGEATAYRLSDFSFGGVRGHPIVYLSLPCSQPDLPTRLFGHVC